MNIIKELQQAYNDNWDRFKPKWTYNIIPAIPVVGDNYNKMPIKVLSYASCENIDKDYSEKLGKHSLEELLLRGRLKLYESKKYPEFRFSHIEPFNTGEQYIITWFVISKEFKNDIRAFSADAIEFAEQITVSNPVKFTIARLDGELNIDPEDPQCFWDSAPYLIDDLKFLRPNVIIIPKTRFDGFDENYGWDNIKYEAGILKKIKVFQIDQASYWPINKQTRKVKNIDVGKISHWIENCLYKKNIEKHLQWLADKFDNDRDNRVSII